MAIIRNVWNNFKTQPEIWFFYGFVLTGSLSIRKVFFDYPVLGEFNEYAGIYFYLSDLFLLGAVVIWLTSILSNKKSFLSTSRIRPASLAKECSSWNILRNDRGTIFIIIGPLILVVWSLISIKWSNNASIALYRFVKLFEFYLFYLFLALNQRCSTTVKSPNFLRNFFRLVIAIGMINSMLGIIQVVVQHSIGLFWLKESLISPDLPGVAKIVLDGAKFIRAYGLFPHPNILGGFLFLSIILTLTYRRLFHVEQFSPHCSKQCAKWKDGRCRIYSTPKSFFITKNCSTWNKNAYVNKHVLTLVLGIQIVGGILTFSKSAVLGLILAIAYLFGRSIVPRGTIRSAFLFILAAILGVYSVWSDFGSILTKSLAERLVYINISLSIIFGNFLAGIGSGQFVLEMQNYTKQILLAWQFQPVHNIFLLIWSELGLVGFFIIAWFIWKLFHVKHVMFRLESKIVPRETLEPSSDIIAVFKALLIGFFVIALFDHYLWDIQQGQIMLWMVLGLLAGTRSTT